MDLKRKDTPESKVFWDFVETEADRCRMIKPEWAKNEEEKRYDLFLVLVYFATQQGEKTIDMSRNVIAVAFFRGYLEFLEASLWDQALVARKFDSPDVDWVEFNDILAHTLQKYKKNAHIQILLPDLSELFEFKRREYTGAPRSEIWYESRFEDCLKGLNKTRDLALAMSVKDVRKVEIIIPRLSSEEKEILEKIASLAANLLRLV